jgi:hypothetical protein
MYRGEIRRKSIWPIHNELLQTGLSSSSSQVQQSSLEKYFIININFLNPGANTTMHASRDETIC